MQDGKKVMNSRGRLVLGLGVLLCLFLAGCTISSSPGSQTPISMSISPASPNVPYNAPQQFAALEQLKDGTNIDVTKKAQWSSSDTSVATIDAKSGLATPVAQGTTTITATTGAFTANTVLTVGPPAVISITIKPNSPTLVVGQAGFQLTATGNMSDGSTPIDLTSKATWTSATQSVATVDSSGLVDALAVGISLIQASYKTNYGTVTASVTAIVNPALQSITVLPANSSIAVGTVEQMMAIGSYSDGSTQDVTKQDIYEPKATQWTSSKPATAGVAPGGLVTANASGAPVTITAKVTTALGTVSGMTNLTVSTATITSMSVTPANPALGQGLPFQFATTGAFSDLSTQDLTLAPGTAWSSSDSNVAISASGLISPVSTGSATASTITSTFGSQSPSTTLTVSATQGTITVAPAKPSIPFATTQQFTATSNSTPAQDLTSLVTWTSASSSVASISATGLATANGQGSTTITATAPTGSASGGTQLTVTGGSLQSIAVSPTTAAIAPGTTAQFTATGSYSDGSTHDLTSLVQWNSSDPSVATIRDFGSSSGVATALGSGTATIGTVFGSVTASTATLTVNAGVTPVSIAVTPNPLQVTLGSAPTQLKAVASFSDGTQQDITALVTWQSSDITKIVVSSSGLATSAGTGGATITASFGGAPPGSTVVTVTP